MEFCSQCRGRMIPQRRQPQANVCSKCGTKQILETNNTVICLSQPISDRVCVVDEDVDLQLLPPTRVQCPECGGYRAYYRTLELTDEEETIEVQIFKCTHCMHTWRERW
jgi:DNA-directed RNA polymerase subunit M/transcription elongation factor TFIIS